MRRIIERVVTVVTTTTWKISWETDTSHSDPTADPVSSDLPNLHVLSETAQSIQPGTTVIETKEADPHEREKALDQTAEEPPRESYTYQSKIEGNEKP
jgi:hypothetical protein